jgi:hypothetical protein
MRRLATLLFTLTFSPSLFADEIRIPVGQQGQSEIALPARGDSKIKVLDRFGLADEEHPAVGQPPITPGIIGNSPYISNATESSTASATTSALNHP